MRFGPHKHFTVKACYYAMNYERVTVLDNTDICNSLVSKKCKIFAWLALHNRINTRERLSGKCIILMLPAHLVVKLMKAHSSFICACPHTSMIWQKFLIPV
jgi:hypothetical protein